MGLTWDIVRNGSTVASSSSPGSWSVTTGAGTISSVSVPGGATIANDYEVRYAFGGMIGNKSTILAKDLSSSLSGMDLAKRQPQKGVGMHRFFSGFSLVLLLAGLQAVSASQPDKTSTSGAPLSRTFIALPGKHSCRELFRRVTKQTGVQLRVSASIPCDIEFTAQGTDIPVHTLITDLPKLLSNDTWDYQWSLRPNNPFAGGPKDPHTYWLYRKNRNPAAQSAWERKYYRDRIKLIRSVMDLSYEEYGKRMPDIYRVDPGLAVTAQSPQLKQNVLLVSGLSPLYLAQIQAGKTVSFPVSRLKVAEKELLGKIVGGQTAESMNKSTGVKTVLIGPNDWKETGRIFFVPTAPPDPGIGPDIAVWCQPRPDYDVKLGLPFTLYPPGTTTATHAEGDENNPNLQRDQDLKAAQAEQSYKQRGDQPTLLAK
jgi:hypothetical protein